MNKVKSYEISKQVVIQAYQSIKANAGAAGVDEQTIKEFENNLKDNLYKLWNRLSSGSYFPPPVLGVAIPKKNGGERILGIPTVADRIAQAVVRLTLEPSLERIFHKDSYGYRPLRSAHQALERVRQRCWKYDWVLEFDIKGLFDNIDHELLMKAVNKHTDKTWVKLYIERWIKAPLVRDGETIPRNKGTPQGGVISPVLANLFLHYTFDIWMGRQFPSLEFCRYADDGLIHCKSRVQAEYAKEKLRLRLKECRLELNESKTRIVYCKDKSRQAEYSEISFDFLGYTFRPRMSYSPIKKEYFVNFSPAISRASIKAISQEMKRWKINLRSSQTLEDFARTYNPILRGWWQYYGYFYKSAITVIFNQLNRMLTKWAMKKYRTLRHSKTQASKWLTKIARGKRELFFHWQLGIFPAAE
jgi:RNA-directed DNA polymerase